MITTDPAIRKWLSGRGTEIPLFKVFIPESAVQALGEVLFSGYIGEGPRVRDFEQRVGAYVRNQNVIAVSSGSAALQLALRLAGVTSDDDVISTPVTCVATNQAILLSGAKIVWADIDPATGNMNPYDVAKRITPRTKAIVMVHWGGYPCDLEAINTLAAQHGIKVIEDACHAFGSTYCGVPLGSHSDFVCFSFQAIKTMTTGDGGALACKDQRDYTRGLRLRWHGIDRSNIPDDWVMADIEEVGYNFRMNDVSAALGLEQLGYIDANLAKARANSVRYRVAFNRLRSVRTLRYDPRHESSYWLYTLLVPQKTAFIRTMQRAGITTSEVHARNDRFSVFKEFRSSLPGVEEFCAQHICIPVGWWLHQDDLDHIIQTVVRYDHTIQSGIDTKVNAEKEVSSVRVV